MRVDMARLKAEWQAHVYAERGVPAAARFFGWAPKQLPDRGVMWRPGQSPPPQERPRWKPQKFYVQIVEKKQKARDRKSER